MPLPLLNSLFFALLLTIIIELIIAWLLGYKKKPEIITIILINVITNPLLNYLLLINDRSSFFKITLGIIILLELIVVLIEWGLLFFTLQEKPKKLLVLSFVMNLCSFLTGLIIFKQY